MKWGKDRDMRSLRRMSWTVRNSFLQMFGDRASLFGVGFLLGMLLAVVYQNKSTETVDLLRYSYDFAYEKWLFGLGYQSSPLSPDENRYKDKNGTEIENPIRDRTEAAFLHEKIKVICIVFPGKSLDYAVAVNNTWGKHCTELRFYHHKMKNATLPIRTLPSGSSFELLCSALLEISREKVKFDWIFFATDNTFVIPENFRYYVASLNSSDPHYLGHTMTFWQVHYNWKNAGFAISKGTATALLAKFQDKKACTAGGRFWNNEDWYLGKHLYDLGIKPVDTRHGTSLARVGSTVTPSLGFSFPALSQALRTIGRTLCTCRRTGLPAAPTMPSPSTACFPTQRCTSWSIFSTIFGHSPMAGSLVTPRPRPLPRPRSSRGRSTSRRRSWRSCLAPCSRRQRHG